MANNKQDESPITRSELLEAIRLLQDGQAKAAETTLLSAAALIKQSLPQQPSAEDSKKILEAAQAKLTTCGTCGQKLAACNDKHRMVEVLPKNDDFVRWFKGLRVNGVRYSSSRRGHLIPVPANLDVESQIAKWEDQEKINQMGRKIWRNSGSIGPGGRFKKAFPGFA